VLSDGLQRQTLRERQAVIFGFGILDANEADAVMLGVLDPSLSPLPSLTSGNELDLQTNTDASFGPVCPSLLVSFAMGAQAQDQGPILDEEEDSEEEESPSEDLVS